MAEEQGTSTEPSVDASTQDAGTTDPGQPSQEPSGQPNDSVSMQADYTRKTQELAQQRDSLTQREQNIAQQEQSFRQREAQMQGQYQQNQQGTPGQQNGYAPNNGGQHDLVREMTEQFGTEGAATIARALSLQGQHVEQTRQASDYKILQMQGETKHGKEAWSKHDYTDTNGAARNKVADMVMLNGLSDEQAWNATNPLKREELEQQIRNEVEGSLTKRAGNTPASAGTSVPSGGKAGHISSFDDAFNAAYDGD